MCHIRILSKRYNSVSRPRFVDAELDPGGRGKELVGKGLDTVRAGLATVRARLATVPARLAWSHLAGS